MSGDPSFKMSQDYELVAPQKKRAYPINIGINKIKNLNS